MAAYRRDGRDWTAVAVSVSSVVIRIIRRRTGCLSITRHFLGTSSLCDAHVPVYVLSKYLDRINDDAHTQQQHRKRKARARQEQGKSRSTEP